MENKENKGEREHLNIIIKLLGLLLTQKDFSSKSQQEQIYTMKKVGLRNIDIASILGISSQQVVVSIKRISKRKTKKES